MKKNNQLAPKGSFASFTNAMYAWHILNNVLPNPDTVLRKRGSGIHIYRELLSDAHLAACLRSRKSPVLAKEWQMKKNGSAAVFKKLKDWFDDLGKNAFLDDFMDIVFWGYYPTELIWQLSDGLWLPKPVPKPPEWFLFFIGDSGEPELRFISKQNPVNGVAPPDEFTMICPSVGHSYDNPYGRGVASLCFWPIVFKRAGIEFWMTFAERFSIPWVKGSSEKGMSEEDLKKFAEKLEDLVQDAVIALTGGQDVSLLSDSGKSASGDLYEGMCAYMDLQISKGVLSQTMTTEVGEKGGALATAKVHLDVRADVVEGDLKLAQEFFQSVIRTIMQRNGYNPKDAPVISPFEEEDIRAARAERDAKLNNTMKTSGVRLSRRYFQEKYFLEDHDIEDHEAQETPETPETKETKETKETQDFSESGDPFFAEKKSQQAVDRLADMAISAANPIMEDMISQIIEIIRGATSYDEILPLVMTAFPKIPAGKLTELLSRAMFSAQIFGQVSE